MKGDLEMFEKSGRRKRGFGKDEEEWARGSCRRRRGKRGGGVGEGGGTGGWVGVGEG